METADKYCCRTLPMRNWYKMWHVQIVHHHRQGYLSDITYEELIHSWSPCGWIFNWNLSVGHYLWGIDTNRTSPACSCTFVRLQVGHYLWGIDTLSPHNHSIPAHAHLHESDITYEELIQLKISPFLQVSDSVGHYLWGIDTAPSGRRPPVTWATKSDITYEELIRFAETVHQLRYLPECRTLPMRNWYFGINAINLRS